MVKVIEIIPGLYTRGQLSKGTRPEVLESMEIKRVVSLTHQGEPALTGWKGYTHWPMSDGRRIDESRLRWVVKKIVDSLRQNELVLVMCHAGRNRTGLVVCLVLCKWLSISGEAALRLFRHKRPRGVANKAFERYLLSIPSGDEL